MSNFNRNDNKLTVFILLGHSSKTDQWVLQLGILLPQRSVLRLILNTDMGWGPLATNTYRANQLESLQESARGYTDFMNFDP
ncbi:unnamed protein product, partial [Bubo scandiacus]